MAVIGMLVACKHGSRHPAGNTPPLASAGADQSVIAGSTVTLNGSGSSDADGDSLTFSWTLTVRPAGSAAILTAPTSVSPTFIADVEGEYRAQLVVSDGQSSSSPDVVVVTTTRANAAPVANAGPDQTVFTGEPVTLDATGSSDADGDALSFLWTTVTQPAGSTATLSSTAVPMPEFTPDLAGDYTFRLTVDDGHGATATDLVTITTEVQDREPVANAGPDQAVAVGDTVTLDGSASGDPDGSPLTFDWSFVFRPDGSNATMTGATTQSPSFTADVAGDFVVQLVVNDGQLESEPDTVLISTVNTPPVADAGADQSVDVGDAVQLDGSGSSDANGDALSFLWSLTTRPDGSSAAIADPLVPQPTFVADQAGLYVAQLIVNDGTVDSPPDTINVTAAGAPATPVITVAATDASASEVGSDTGSFTLTRSGSTAQELSVVTIAFSGTAIRGVDYQSSAAGFVNFPAGQSSVTVTITPSADALVEGPETVILTVVDGPDWDVGDDSSATLTIVDAPAPVITVTATDSNASEVGPDNATFTLTRSGSNAQDLGVVTIAFSGTAVRGSDYQSSAAGFVNFPAGQSSVTITITPTPDALVEGAETVTLSVVDGPDWDVGTPGSATATIADAPTPVIAVTATDPDASEEGPDTGTFTLTRSGSNALDLGVVTIEYSGTATRGNDYTASTAGFVNFPAGQSSVTITITPNPDGLAEGTETAILTVVDGPHWDVGTPGSATVNIADE